MTKQYDKVLGALLGCAVGDSMGAPTETRPTYLIKKEIGGGDYVRDFVTPPMDTFAAGMPRGTVTDDFSLSYLIIKNCLKAGGVTHDANVEALRQWITDYPQYSLPFSGPTTRDSLTDLLGLTQFGPSYHGQDHCCTNNSKATNGAAMKAWVAGLFNPGNPDKAVDDAITIGFPTHQNVVALAGATAVAAAVAAAFGEGCTLSGMLDAGLYGARVGYERAWNMCSQKSAGANMEARIMEAVSIGLKYAHDFDKLLEEMADVIGCGLNANEAVPAAFGFAVAAQGRPMDAIYMAVNAGNDTDTVASITGAMCGALKGTAGISKEHLTLLTQVNHLDIEGLAKEFYGTYYG